MAGPSAAIFAQDDGAKYSGAIAARKHGPGLKPLDIWAAYRGLKPAATPKDGRLGVDATSEVPAYFSGKRCGIYRQKVAKSIGLAGWMAGPSAAIFAQDDGGKLFWCNRGAERRPGAKAPRFMGCLPRAEARCYSERRAAWR